MDPSLRQLLLRTKYWVVRVVARLVEARTLLFGLDHWRLLPSLADVAAGPTNVLSLQFKGGLVCVPPTRQVPVVPRLSLLPLLTHTRPFVV